MRAGGPSGRHPPEYTFSLPEARTIASALDSAIALVSNRLAAPCLDCDPNEPCTRHRTDLARAHEYRYLRAELGALLPRPGDKWGH